MSFERQESNNDSSEESEDSGEYRDSVENVDGSAPPADEQEDQWDYHEEELSFNAGRSTPTQPSPINRRVFSPDPNWPPRHLSSETDFNFLESVDIFPPREEPVFEEEEHSEADSDNADIVMPPKPKPTKEEALAYQGLIEV